MIHQIFTLAIRVMLKNWLYTTLCVLSLVLGLIVFLANLAVYEKVRNLDADLKYYDQLYEFRSDWIGIGGSGGVGTSPRTADILRNRFPEIEMTTRLIRFRQLVAETSRLRQYEELDLVDPNFFELVDYPFVEGDPTTALDRPFSIILSRTAAERYFGDKPAVGKTIMLDGELTFEVTAVMEDLPRTSNLRPLYGSLDMIATIESLQKTEIKGTNFQQWGMNRAVTLAVIPPSLTIDELEDGLKTLAIDHWPERFHDSMRIEARQFGKTLFELAKFGSLALMDVLLALGLGILLVASANCSTLFFAQNAGRAREIALRKTLGSSRWLIVAQFLAEGLLISLAAFLVALLVVPFFLDMSSNDNFPVDFSSLMSARGILWMFLIVPFITLVGGALPALKNSSIRPNQAFRDDFVNSKSKRSANIVIQFVFAIVLLICTGVIWQQQSHIKAASLRYAQDQIVVIDRFDNEKIRDRFNVFKQHLIQAEGIVNLSASSFVPSDGGSASQKFRIADVNPDQTFWVPTFFIDPEFFDIYDIGLIAGRFLSPDIASDIVLKGEALEDAFSANAIISVSATELLGFSSPNDAIGKVLKTVSKKPYPITIVGIVEDTLMSAYPGASQAKLFIGSEPLFKKVSVRISPEDVKGTISRIENIWDEVYPEYPIEWQFLDEKFAAIYNLNNNVTIGLITTCILALVISALGMYGLAGFTAQNRAKEISVRRVMGASLSNVVKMLLFDFAKPVLVANLIAWPIGFLAMRMYLNLFADRIALSPVFFIGAGLLALLITFIVVSGHILRVARAHPAKTLRYE